MTSLADSWGGPWASAWPSELAEQAETGRPRLNLQLRRVYVQCERALADGSASSMSIFGCALSRLMQRLAAEPVQLWQTGACMAVQKELGAQGARVLVEQRVDSKVDGRRQAVLTLNRLLCSVRPRVGPRSNLSSHVREGSRLQKRRSPLRGQCG